MEPMEDEEEAISSFSTEDVDFPENLFRREELAAKRLFSRLVLLLNKSLSLLELGEILEPSERRGCSFSPDAGDFSSDEDAS